MIFDDECYTNKKSIHETKIEEIKITNEIYHKLFMYDKNINWKKLRLTNISLYSITKVKYGKPICKIIYKLLKTKDITITDAFGNVGGIGIMFSKYFKTVNICEIIKLHCEMLLNNLTIYGYNNKVNIYCGDYLDFMEKLNQDIIFFDPPWNDEYYKKKNKITLEINNINIYCIINNLLNKAKYILLFVPYNYDFDDLKFINSKYKIKKLINNNKKTHLLVIIKGLKI